jgi:hypothetical protein
MGVCSSCTKETIARCPFCLQWVCAGFRFGQSCNLLHEESCGLSKASRNLTKKYEENVMANLAVMDKAAQITEFEFLAIKKIWDEERAGGMDGATAEQQIKEILQVRHSAPDYKAWWIVCVARDLIWDPEGKWICNSAPTGRIPTQGRISW